MKTTSVLASLLFSSMAAAVPLNKRALVTYTHTVIETQVIFTTVYAGHQHTADVIPTPSPEKKQPEPSPPAYTPPVAAAPEKEEPQVPQTTPTPAPQPSPTPTPKPEPIAKQPQAEVPPQQEYQAPKVSSSPPPPPLSSSASPPPPPPPAYTPPAYNPPPVTAPSGGNSHSGDITVYDPAGGYGACGTKLENGDFVAAISEADFGPTTHDVMTGATTNAYCGKSVSVSRGGKSVTVKIMDKCAGCKKGDIDLSRGAWDSLTNSAYGSRFAGTWSE